MMKVVAAAAVLALSAKAALALPLLNEFEPNPEGIDPATQSIELLGTPGAAFDLWILSIESDSGNAFLGLVDRVSNVTGTFDGGGLAVVSVPDLENPGNTLVLLDGFTGSTDTDIDTDNDGAADDLSTFGTVLDAIGVPDSAADEATLYGADLGGTDFSFTGDEPELIFRDALTLALFAVNDEGEDPEDVVDASGDAVDAGGFDISPVSGSSAASTFGAANPTLGPGTVVPLPASALLLLSALGGLAALRRRA